MASAMPNVHKVNKVNFGRPRDTLPVCANSKSTVQALSYYSEWLIWV